jgi:hypothetical protein
MNMSESVYEMSPEDAMLHLWTFAREWWWDTRDKIWEGKLPGPSWRWFYDAVERLERDPLEALIEMGESAGFDRNEIYQTWNVLSERQREEALQYIKCAFAQKGTSDFLGRTVDYLLLLITTIKDIDERRRILKDVLDKAYQFLDGKISFDELMNYIGKLLSPLMNGRDPTLLQMIVKAFPDPLMRGMDPEVFRKGIALSKYLTRAELENRVKSILIEELKNKLNKY